MFERYSLHWNKFQNLFIQDDSDSLSLTTNQNEVFLKSYLNHSNSSTLCPAQSKFENGFTFLWPPISLIFLYWIYKRFFRHLIGYQMKTLLKYDNFTIYVTNKTIWKIVTHWAKPFLIDCPKINPNLKCSDNWNLECHRNYCWQMDHPRWWCIRWNSIIGLKSDLESFSSGKPWSWFRGFG